MNHLVKNYDELAITEERKKLLQIIEFGIEEIKPDKIIKKNLKIENGKLFIQDKNFDLSQFKTITVLGIGKGSSLSFLALVEVLGGRFTQGMAIDIQQPATSNQQLSTNFKIFAGSHPIPDEKNLSFSKEAVSVLEKLGKNDLLITVIAGGGSALFCYPESELKGRKLLIKGLISRGVGIKEINVVRKHLSLVKGGGLAKIAYPATIIGLIFSDVSGNDLSVVASGPTVLDKTTVDDAKKVLEKYGLESGEFFETPKEEKYFEKVHNLLICSNRDALEKMAAKAREFALNLRIYRNDFESEAREAGRVLLSEAKKGELVLVGGETTVKLRGKPFDKTQGKGGRNQELVLGALKYLKEGETIISIASDGWDNTEAAGAIGDEETLRKVKELNLDINEYLDNNDSFNFFSKTGDQIFTGYTGVNVSDLILVYKK